MNHTRCSDQPMPSCSAQIRWTSLVLSATALIFPATASSTETPQPRIYGDPAVRVQIDAQLKHIYEFTTGPGQQLVLLSKDNPLELPEALGTEIAGYLMDGSPARVVGAVWTRKGKYAFEFYRQSGKLLMVYQTFTYFSESAPPDAWHNFMGLPAWESRAYFGAQGAIGYAETLGRQAPALDYSGKKLQQQADLLVNLLERRATRWERK